MSNGRNPFVKNQDQFDRLQAASLGTSNKQMQTCIKQGGHTFYIYSFNENWCNLVLNYSVAFHNGGLEFSERSSVEGLFLRGDVQVVCTTNTLAHGVNLPAHLVIIMSTQY